MISTLNNSHMNAVSSLLSEAGLPTGDIGSVNWCALVGVEEHGALVAAAGLERCGGSLLLRSLVVADSHRCHGIAQDLVSHLHERATRAGHSEIWLLTTDADQWFAKKFDYQAVPRIDAPDDIHASSQFSGICPDSAKLMRRHLNKLS